VARESWAFSRAELRALNLDRRPDAHMLEGACVAYENAVIAYKTIQKEGRYVSQRRLNPTTGEMVEIGIKPHPAVKQGNDAWTLVRSFYSEFGLSPVSRGRLTLERNEGASKAIDDELAKLLAQPRTARAPIVQ